MALVVVVVGSNPGSSVHPGARWRGPRHRPLQHPPPPQVPPMDGWRVLSSYFFFLPLSSPDIKARKKTKHQAQHTCSSAPRHRHRRPTGAASPPRVPLGGFELASLGQQLAARPLQCVAKNPSYELLALSKPLSSCRYDIVTQGGIGYYCPHIKHKSYMFHSMARHRYLWPWPSFSGKLYCKCHISQPMAEVFFETDFLSSLRESSDPRHRGLFSTL